MAPVTDRVIDDRWWRAHEQYLRYQSHADAAWQAAKNKGTPPSLVRQLLERHARMQLLANEHRAKAKEFET